MRIMKLQLRMQQKWMVPVVVAAIAVILVINIYHHQMMNRVAESGKITPAEDAAQSVPQQERPGSVPQNYSLYSWINLAIIPLLLSWFCFLIRSSFSISLGCKVIVIRL